MRIALGIEYDGSPFCGWQRQKGTDTIQQALEDAVSRVADAPVRLSAAGRTDTGVHATEQVVHFDCEAQRENRGWVLGVNSYLPDSVSVLWAKPVDDDFHARYSAISRQYRYVIDNRPVRPAIFRERVTWVHQPLDYTRMQQAASCLQGTHDFTSYRALACQAKSPVRTVHELTVQRFDEFVFLDIRADGFLHHMVRNIAGVLIAIGKAEQEVDWAGTVLERRDRTLGGVTAPPAGLYLVKVQYDGKYGLDPAVQWPAIGTDGARGNEEQ
ncbi:MAG: tRNA pseudouridine(38-40) synthase TruA [Proteobacteria bacterium]|nr:tRNA pseudouridine(38-40) synthase TruA [Pseudomonadota bacterium]